MKDNKQILKLEIPAIVQKCFVSFRTPYNPTSASLCSGGEAFIKTLAKKKKPE